VKELLMKHAKGLGIGSPSGIMLSANLCNLLLAKEMEWRGLGTSYGSDAHTEAPLGEGYPVGGDWFSRGWTSLDMSGYDMPQGRGLSAGEIVRGIAKKQIKMRAIAFSEVRDGLVQIVKGRAARPKAVGRIMEKQARSVTRRYAEMLSLDLLHFAVNGEFEEVGSMAG